MKIIAVLKFALLLSLIAGIPAYIYFFHRELITGFRNLEDVANFIIGYGVAGFFVYFGLQAVQTVILVIPGTVIQVAGGYVYGFWIGFLGSFAGIALGTFFTFYLARILGKDALRLLLGHERFTSVVNRLNKKKALVIIFIIYVIPGLPKDLVGYAAGISQMKFLPFLFLSMAGRLPTLMGSILVGSMMNDKNYVFVIVIIGVFTAFFIAAFIKRKDIATWFDLK